MSPPADASPFAARVQRLREDLRNAGLDALLVTHPPNIRYLTGFSGTAGVLVVTAARCLLIADFRYAAAARELSAARADGAIELVVPDRGYDEAIVSALRTGGTARAGVEAAWLSVGRFNWLTASLASNRSIRESSRTRTVSLIPTERLVEARREIKDATEIATLREAARRLSLVARAVRSFVRTGRSERMVAADIDAALRTAGFERPAFETIVASGANSARPHARPGDRLVADGDGVVLDFGGVYDGYCVDLTRTLHVGVPAPALVRLKAAVREAHAAAMAAVRPGARPSEIDAAARDVLTRHGLGDAFGHGTGHGLGLEVHEDPRIAKLPAALPDTPVVPGMVFTIEPGAYVDGVGGVRIEDDVLVVEGGCDVLTDVPIEL
ncbi:MAG: Xaa-Pro peptidase family protein [Acidobacteriota bacterium]|nr:Xaa-Pro peptidase family protein [Acidobacteriota bacterium]